MNLQQVVLPKSYANGFGRRRGGDRNFKTRLENKSPSGKSNAGRIPNAAGGKVGCPSHDRLVYLVTCLIGHPGEFHVKNGSIFTGIFHATDAERDFVNQQFQDAVVTKDSLARELQHAKQQEIMRDPAIAQSHRVKMERVGTLGS
ncbi:hypothetical protein SLEP1_g47334 [Rubroshorea leprosula]|uniref:Ataxin 2 SM domain-containing protein n=1 Tax=Rubroshorea leprosula TaxID=152421 RepID=A0AAV5LSR5_9ROSI|nr:hypothetical protein SLEP1_g47334 [Rubroshorea leprosula]